MGKQLDYEVAEVLLEEREEYLSLEVQMGFDFKI